MNKPIFKKLILVFGYLMLFLTVVSVTYVYRIYKSMLVDTPKVVESYEDLASPTPTPDPLAPKNILILGYGGEGHSGGYLTDTMIIAHVAPRDKAIVLISLPRDMWVDLDYEKGKTNSMKINAAYAIGFDDEKYPNKKPEYKGALGASNLSKLAVSRTTGLPIHYFVSVDFTSFKNIVEILGGVTVNVPYTFDDYYYPVKGKEDDPCGKTEEDIEALTATLSGEVLERQFECRYEHLHFDKGVQTLDPETALKFVRSRHSSVNGSDFGRALRQQAFLNAVKEDLVSVKSITKAIPIATEISKNVKTDIDIADALEISKSEEGIEKNMRIQTISLNDENVLEPALSSDGQYILRPKGNDWEVVHKYIQEQLGKVLSPAPAQKTTPIPTGL